MALTMPSRHDQFWSLPRKSKELSRNRYSLQPAPRKSLPPSQPVAKQPTSYKWFQEPKIPIHMNMSTLIRMRNNEPKRDQQNNLHDVTNRQVLADLSCSPRSHGMFDYMKEKLVTIQRGEACSPVYSKNLYWKETSVGESNVFVSAKPSGDGFLGNGTYHRVSAIKVSDRRSGCNMQYVEKVSFESKAQTVAVESKVRGNCDQGDARDSIKLQNLSISNSGKSHEKGDDRVENSVDIRRKKIKKQKKPVVATCLKRTSIKYVKKC